MLGDPPLSDLSRELLALERERTEDEALKARVMERAQAVVSGERASSVGLRRAGLVPKRASRRLLRTLPLIAASFVVVSLAVAGARVYVWKAPESKPLVVEQAPAAARQVRQPAIGSQRPQAALSSQVTSEPAVTPRAEAPPPSAPDNARSLNVKQYAAELALLEPARSSIGRGDYAAALSAINQHRHEFPASQLSEEREALRIRALWGLGQKPAALSAAKSFRKRYPRSSLLSWLQDQSAPTP